MRNITPPVRDDMADYVAAIAARPMAARTPLAGYEDAVRMAYMGYRGSTTDILALQPLELREPGHGALLRENYSALSKGRALEELAADIYEAAEFRCPMCNFEQAATVDHFLGKGAYPEFSILARNLVAACNTCNNKKGARPANGFVHAYFDELPNQQVLVATTVWNPELHISYTLEADPGVEVNLFDRLSNQFEILRLEDRFAREAGYVLSEIIGNCAEPYARGGSALVKAELARQADVSVNVYGINHYKTALLRALAADDRFCDGGFRQ
jgi:hypothetical protein